MKASWNKFADQVASSAFSAGARTTATGYSTTLHWGGFTSLGGGGFTSSSGGGFTFSGLAGEAGGTSSGSAGGGGGTFSGSTGGGGGTHPPSPASWMSSLTMPCARLRKKKLLNSLLGDRETMVLGFSWCRG
jgi:hypothetical protein